MKHKSVWVGIVFLAVAILFAGFVFSSLMNINFKSSNAHLVDCDVLSYSVYSYEDFNTSLFEIGCDGTTTDASTAANLDDFDGKYYETVPFASGKPYYHLFFFYVNVSSASVSSFNVSWAGFMNVTGVNCYAGCFGRIYLYIWNSSNWQYLENWTQFSYIEKSYNFISPTNYINDSGYINFLALADQTYYEKLDSDSANVNVTYNAAPTINFVYPTNNVWYNYMVNVNFTTTDTTGGACWWSNNSGLTNHSVGCGSNITGQTWVQGINNITVWANNSNGVNSTSYNKTFYIDTLIPNMLVTYPASYGNYSVARIGVNFTARDTNLQKVKWSLDGGQNITLNNFSNFSYTFTEGLHNITLWANDTVKNSNSSTVTKFRIDTTAPVLTIVYPTDYADFDTESTGINYTLTDAGVGTFGKVWWTNDSSVTNHTLTNVGDNITVIDDATGSHTVTIWANDTLGNLATKVIHYSYTSSGVGVTINYPTNDIWLKSALNIPFNFTATGTLVNCSLYGNFTGTWALNQTNRSTVTSGSAFVFNKLNVTSNANYKFNVYCYDDSANFGSAPINFTMHIDSTLPSVTINSVTTTTGSQVITFNYTATDTNMDYCKYSVYDSFGVPNNGMSNLTESNCGGVYTPSANSYGAFTLVICADDMAGNEQCQWSGFTLSSTDVPPDTPPGGGTDTTVDENTTVPDAGFCGDAICQDGKEGRPFRGEDFATCFKDCGLNFDTILTDCISTDAEKRKNCKLFGSNFMVFALALIILILLLTGIYQFMKKKKRTNYTRT